MTGIDCASFLALIQLLVAFDFGLFYLDENHKLAKLYKSYKKNLQSQVKSILKSSKAVIRQSEKSSDEKCIMYNALLAESYNHLKDFISEGKVNYDGWAFLGLYGGIYGVVCMFFVGLFKCESEYFAQTYILICAQLVAFIDVLIICRICLMSPQPFKRNILHNTTITMGVLLIAWGLTSFGATIKCLPNFEFPFIVSLLIIAMPVIVFICYVLFSQCRIFILQRSCRRYIKKIDRIMAL